MNKYKVQVVMSYVQTIEVESDNQHDAEVIAFESFELNKAHQGEGQAWTLEINEG